MSPHINQIIENDLCIGCGICAGICPQEIISIDFNVYGEYHPNFNSQCSTYCGLCMKVCPFNDKNKDENEIGNELFGNIPKINYCETVGYYLDSYVGCSLALREKCASGGIGTWILKSLLELNIVDYVVCVSPNNESEKLFKYQIYEDVESVISSSGSVYYPVELSDVIKTILKKPGNYAIVGLPCFVKSIRYAMSINKKLHDRIVVVVGLTCGQLKNKYYTAYLSELSNAGGKLQRVYYRKKNKELPSNNFYFQCINENGKKGQVLWNGGMSEAFINRWFTLNACNFCDDVFAELADVTLMDAWLPEYLNDAGGTSLFIVRKPQVMDLIEKESKKKEFKVKRISIQKIIQSQKGVIDFKRKYLPYRLKQAQKSRMTYIPKKRYEVNNKINIFKRKEMLYYNEMQKKSKKLILGCSKDNSIDLNSFMQGIYPYKKQIIRLEFVSKLLYPVKIIRKIRGRKNKND